MKPLNLRSIFSRLQSGAWVVGLTLALMACSNKQSATPAAEDGEPQAFGLSAEQVYARRCASCHGPAGKGDGPLARNYPRVGDLSNPATQAAHTDEGLEEIITRGFRRMPPVRHLTTPELKLLVEYTRVLGGQKPAAPAETEDAEVTED